MKEIFKILVICLLISSIIAGVVAFISLQAIEDNFGEFSKRNVIEDPVFWGTFFAQFFWLFLATFITSIATRKIIDKKSI